jgi:hypothetical protein
VVFEAASEEFFGDGKYDTDGVEFADALGDAFGETFVPVLIGAVL